MAPPIVAHHLILSAYGFWLPNDPRGSWSTTVRAEHLQPFGEATKVDTHRSVAHVDHDRRLRLMAKAALKHRPVHFDDEQRQLVGEAIGGYVVRSGLRLYACAVMPDHVHLVSAVRDCSIEQTANLIKGATTTVLKRAGRHPFADETREGAAPPSPWARKHWVVFLHEHDMARTIGYVAKNPERAGLPRQQWGFVVGWEEK